MDCLKLENQLCFPLYAASKEVIRRYKPLLDKADLTYTQYIALMALWEDNEINVKSLGEKLFLYVEPNSKINSLISLFPPVNQFKPFL